MSCFALAFLAGSGTRASRRRRAGTTFPAVGTGILIQTGRPVDNAVSRLPGVPSRYEEGSL